MHLAFWMSARFLLMIMSGVSPACHPMMLRTAGQIGTLLNHGALSTVMFLGIISPIRSELTPVSLDTTLSTRTEKEWPS